MENQAEPSTIRPWLLITLIVVILAGVGFFGWNYFQSKKSAVTPTPSPIATISVADWKTYENTTYGYSFKYPSNVEGIDSSELSKVTVFLKDSLSIILVDVVDQTLDQYAKVMKDDPRNTSSEELIQKSGTFAGKTSTILSWSNASLQNVDFVTINNKGYAIWSDKTDAISNQILSTFKFTK